MKWKRELRWLTVIGDLLEDVVVWIDAPMVVGTDNPATVHRSRGGSAANVAATAAEAGAAVRFIGRVGDDGTGLALTDLLDSVGVQVRVQRAGSSGSVVVIVDHSAERTMFPDRAAAAELGPIDPGWLEGTRVLHLPSYGLTTASSRAAIVDAATYVRSSGGLISIDTSAISIVTQIGYATVHSLFDELQPALIFANAPEAALLGLAGATPRPGRTIVIKNGGDPAVLRLDDGTTITVAAPPVEKVRDTTGAGDAFAGGFLSAWMRGEPPEAACVTGHQRAAAVLGHAGAGGQA